MPMTTVEVFSIEGGKAWECRTRLEGTIVGSVISADKSVILTELSQRLDLLRGLDKGKTLTSFIGRG